MSKPPRIRKPKKKTGCLPWAMVAGLLWLIWIGVHGPSGSSVTKGPPPAAAQPAGLSPAERPPTAPSGQVEPPSPAEGLLGLPKAAQAAAITGKIVGVHDGDTVTLLTAEKKQIKIRLEAIDAPETGQEYGQKSKAALSALVFGKNVEARISKEDRYGRSLAWIEADGVSVNRRMVADGWAWQYLEYNRDPDIAAMQEKAKAARLGIWAAANPPMPPWEFRKLGKNSPVPAIPKATEVEERPAPKETKTERPSAGAKYWINSNGVRHNQSCRWYGNTKSGHYTNEPEGSACGKCRG
jgi:endonuclease YncB( thermonuclease family)